MAYTHLEDIAASLDQVLVAFVLNESQLLQSYFCFQSATAVEEYLSGPRLLGNNNLHSELLLGVNPQLLEIRSFCVTITSLHYSSYSFQRILLGGRLGRLGLENP